MGDAVIICGSTAAQVKANTDACRDETPLPQVKTKSHTLAPNLPGRSMMVDLLGVTPRLVSVPLPYRSDWGRRRRRGGDRGSVLICCLLASFT